MDTTFMTYKEENEKMRAEITRLQAENAELRSIISENVKEAERMNEQQEPEGVHVSQEPAMHPMQQILDGDRELFLLENRYELKYLPIYANIPDPTYVVKWVWEVRDANGYPVAKASEWLYHAIDLARGMAGIASAPTDLAAKVKELEAEVVEYGEGILSLTSTVNYLVGIAEKGKGHGMPDGVSVEHFVLGYVKSLESRISELTEQVKVAKDALGSAKYVIEMAQLHKPGLKLAQQEALAKINEVLK